MKSLLVAMFVMASAVCFAAGFQAGDQIVDFKLPTVDGKMMSTADMRAGKPVILKFGATWCGWCNKMVPQLNKVVDRFRKDVVVIDIDIKEDATTVKEHNAKMGAKFITLVDKDGVVAGQYLVQGIPVVIVADANGKVLLRQDGYTEFDPLRKVLEPAVKAAKDAKKAATKTASPAAKSATVKK